MFTPQQFNSQQLFNPDLFEAVGIRPMEYVQGAMGQAAATPVTATSTMPMSSPAPSPASVTDRALDTARLDLGPTPFDPDRILQENREFREESTELMRQLNQEATATRRDDIQYQRFLDSLTRDEELGRQLEVTGDDRATANVAWMRSLRGRAY